MDDVRRGVEDTGLEDAGVVGVVITRLWVVCPLLGGLV